MRNVLALDLGSTVGWALRDGATLQIYHGVLYLRGSRPERLARLRDWLSAFVWSEQVDTVVFERPFARGKDATRSAWGAAGVVEATATGGGAAVLDAEVKTVKKHWTGRGDASKDDMIRTCEANGLFPGTEHEADALAVLHYALDTMEES